METSVIKHTADMLNITTPTMNDWHAAEQHYPLAGVYNVVPKDDSEALIAMHCIRGNLVQAAAWDKAHGRLLTRGGYEEAAKAALKHRNTAVDAIEAIWPTIQGRIVWPLAWKTPRVGSK